MISPPSATCWWPSKVVLHVDGYASKTGKESANWRIYSYQRAQEITTLIQEMAGEVRRKDGRREYDLELRPYAQGVAPWANDPKDPKYRDDPEARVVKVYVKTDEVMEALRRPQPRE